MTVYVSKWLKVQINHIQQCILIKVSYQLGGYVSSIREIRKIFFGSEMGIFLPLLANAVKRMLLRVLAEVNY